MENEIKAQARIDAMVASDDTGVDKSASIGLMIEENAERNPDTTAIIVGII